jgi:hypothetical protein
LLFAGVTRAHHGFFHLVGGVFPHMKTILGRGKKHNPPCHPKLEGRGRVFVHKGFFNGCLFWGISLYNLTQVCIKIGKSFR